MTDISDPQAGELHYSIPNYGNKAMNEQEKLWSGDFGKTYTDRNRVDWRARIPFWKRVLNETGARSVTEIGCNAGWNLSAIRRAYPDIELSGIEINEYAAMQARIAGLDVPSTLPVVWPRADLVFTTGVLIHQNPDAVKIMMERIVEASFQYVLAVEYAAETEQEVKYRGMEGMLWKRPYGRMYRAMGLKEVDSWPAGDGFDRCAAWLLSKF